jgi:hypothetical protein
MSSRRPRRFAQMKRSRKGSTESRRDMEDVGMKFGRVRDEDEDED